MIGPERVLFSVDYPHEEMASGARWFDELVIPGESKVKIGRGNANNLLKLGLTQYPASSAAGFGS
jgi:predicted TIM-barrel fold metal-dependent hydrolase